MRASNMQVLTRFCGLTLAAVLLTTATCARPEVAAGQSSADGQNGAALTDGECLAAPAGYEGPCPLGALPAFFDDFGYTSGHTTRSVADAPHGDIFGPNRWVTERGEEMTRAWYRYNRDDLPVPGAITFENGVMRLRVPAGTSAEDFPRVLVLHTGATFHSGTYHYRLRLSSLWPGQQVRQAAWTMSPAMLVFESEDASGPLRTVLWSELDFENENHFLGDHRQGRFFPDFVTRMSVANHFGRIERPGQRNQRLSRRGPVAYNVGAGHLARSGPASTDVARAAPRVPDWSGEWLDLIINVDPRERTATYRMQPVRDLPRLRPVAERSIVVGPDFFPRYEMHPALSLHWLESAGRLQEDLWMEVDWVYHTPVPNLDVEVVLKQVEALRASGIVRLNTTESPTFLDHGRPLTAVIRGPEQVRCDETARWMLDVDRAGIYHSTLRVRTVVADGHAGPWKDVHDLEVSITPQRVDSHIELIATLQDRWEPHGRSVDAVSGWEYPHPDNVTTTTRHRAKVTCP